MEKQDQQQIDSMKAEIAQLKRLVHSLAVRVKSLEKDNIRIKHDTRGMKAGIAQGARFV